jgi:FkbM family methyltransferase
LNILPSVEQKRILDAIWRWILPKTQLIQGNIFGHKIVIPNSGKFRQGQMLNILWGELHEPQTTNLVKEKVKPGQTAIDIGANIGYFTLLFARAVGVEGIVYAFEPNPFLAKILRYNISINEYQNVKVIEKAISNSPGQARFYINKRAHERSSLIPARKSEIITVDTITIDNFFSPSYPKVDWIKVDVEGNEAKALAGMSEILKRNNEIKLIIEFIPKNRGFNADAIFEILEGFSYESLDDNLFCWREV